MAAIVLYRWLEVSTVWEERRAAEAGQRPGVIRRDFLRRSGQGLAAGLLLPFAGCGGSGDDSGGGGPLTFLRCGGDDPVTAKYYREVALPAFAKARGGSRVRYQTVSWESAHDQIFNQIRAGRAPHVLYIGSRWIAEFASLENGLVSLDDVIGKETLEYYPGVLETGQFRGELYGVPNAYSTKALVYRTDLIDRPPATWDELISVAEDVRRRNGGMFGLGIPAANHVTTVDFFARLLFQANGAFFDREGKVTLESGPAVEALTFYSDLYRKHKLTPNPLEYASQDLNPLFRAGKIAMWIDGPWARAALGIDPDNKRTPFASGLLPAGRRRATELVTDSLAVTANADKDAAARFVTFLNSTAQLTRKDLDQGLTPIKPAEVEHSDEFTTDPWFRTFVEMSKYGVPQARPAIWEPFQGVVAGMVQQVMLGRAAPEQALADAAKAIRDQKLEPRT